MDSSTSNQWIVASAVVTAAAVALASLFLYLRSRDPLSPQEYRKCKLVERQNLTESVRLLVIELPRKALLNLPAGKHVSFRFLDHQGMEVKRSYTPTETSTPGRFEVVLKVYPNSKMGTHLDTLPLGGDIEVKSPTGHISYEAGVFKMGTRTVNARDVLMIAGGTGLTPMLQIIKAVLRRADQDKTRLTLIYASSTTEDILLHAELLRYARGHPEQFKLVLTVSKPNAEWEQLRRGADATVHRTVGRISQELIKEHGAGAGDGCVAGYCGPAAFERTAREILVKSGYQTVNLFRW